LEDQDPDLRPTLADQEIAMRTRIIWTRSKNVELSMLVEYPEILLKMIYEGNSENSARSTKLACISGI